MGVLDKFLDAIKLNDDIDNATTISAEHTAIIADMQTTDAISHSVYKARGYFSK